MSVAAQGPLAGRGVVVTRPRERAQALCDALREAGGQPILYPALELQTLPDLEPFYALVDRLERFRLAIFVSPSSVARGFVLLRARRGANAWPVGLCCAAIGRGSRRALIEQGLTGIWAPARQSDSEALLALPELQQVRGWEIIIFRGLGGREQLGAVLQARGARISYAECYRRARPRVDAAPLLAAWARGQVHAVTLFSVESLTNFHEMIGLPGRELLRTTPVFVGHQRIVDAARKLGVGEAILATQGDRGMLEALVAHFNATK